MHARLIDIARYGTCAYAEPDDDLNPCRGLLWATVISAPLWGVLIAVVM